MVADHATLRDMWDERVRTRPDAEFLVVEDPDTGRVERYTYAEAAREVARAANLFHRLGVGKGDRVAVHLCNRAEFVECFLALTSIGAVVVPLNTSFTAPECTHILAECEVGVLVTEHSLAAGDLAGFAPVVVTVGDGPGGYADLKAEQPCRLASRPELRPDDLAEIMYTSGTTSAPKGVMMTHANMVFSGRYVVWELAMTPADRYLTCMAATHVNLQLSALVPVIAAGCALILERRYSARRLWSQVRFHRATLLQAMAMIVRTLLKQPPDPSDREHFLREVHYFLPLTEREKEEFETRFATRLLNNYGSTETLVGVITDYPEGPRRWPSIGRPGPGYDVRILTPDGRQAAPGRCGEILVRGEAGVSLMAGYWRDPQATAAVFDADGWLRTNDAGYADADGWIYFADRMGDIIKRAGENVAAAEIEDVLRSHPEVADAAVVGVPDPVRDETVKAVVVPAEGASPGQEAIRDYAVERLACFKVPEIIEFRTSLPRGEYGKVLKKPLIDPINQHGKATQ